MPLVEFHCPKCHGNFEAFRRFSELDEVRCPACHGPVTRVWSPFAFNFKNSWQLTEDSHIRGNPDRYERVL